MLLGAGLDTELWIWPWLWMWMLAWMLDQDL